MLLEGSESQMCDVRCEINRKLHACEMSSVRDDEWLSWNEQRAVREVLEYDYGR